jgi:GT2 family glycosyltransferase
MHKPVPAEMKRERHLPNDNFTWSLVVATYKREHILPRCIRLAAKQTRPPAEIIVVDASPTWQETKAVISAGFAESFPNVRLRYVQATVASTTAQRNQGIALAKSDIVFLFDDDSLMFPNCAEEIMRVYAADQKFQVMGVAAILAPCPPDEVATPSPLFAPPSARDSWWRKGFREIFSVQSTHFLPYDGEPRSTSIPDSVRHLHVGVINYMTGSCMTFRRSVFDTEKFCEILKRYAAGEDQDLSYRVSRHGALLLAIDAPLCHLEASGGRLTAFQVAALAALNPAVMQRMYGAEPDMLNKRWRRILLKRFVMNLAKDLIERRVSLPRARGVGFAILKLVEIQRRSMSELTTWYPKFQEEILAA